MLFFTTSSKPGHIAVQTLLIPPSTSLPGRSQYLNWVMERTIPRSMCRIGSVPFPGSGKDVNWKNWKMPKIKAKDNAQVLTVSSKYLTRFSSRGQNLPFLLTSKSDNYFSLLLHISLKKAPPSSAYLHGIAVLFPTLLPSKTVCQRLGACSIL